MPRLLPESLERIRRTVQDEALELFVSQGYAATTTRQIAAAAGVTAGALYNHYPSKEALFAAVATAYHKRIGDQSNPLSAVIESTRFPDDLHELADAIEKLITNHKAYWLLWYIDVLEFGGKHFKDRLAPAALAGNPALQRRFAELRDQKTLRMDPEKAFVMVYMHLFNYFLMESIFSADGHYGLPRDQAVEGIIDVFLRGMMAT